MLIFGTARHHWNYFLAIEKDLEKISRYIEFSTSNLGTYSIELTHILLSASSEIDVLMKLLCLSLDNSQSCENINQYKTVIQNNLRSFTLEEFSIDRYGLNYKPWENCNTGSTNPDWWRSYNNVKHERNQFFHEANLQNAINAVGALLITVVYFYKYAFTNEAGHDVNLRQTTSQLRPESSFLLLNYNYYNPVLVLG